MQNDQDLPVRYLGHAIVYASRRLAVEAAARHGGRVIEGEGAWIAMLPVDDETVARAERATWTEAGTLVCDPEGELPPVWWGA